MLVNWENGLTFDVLCPNTMLHKKKVAWSATGFVIVQSDVLRFARLQLWLFKQSPMRLDPLMKYHSHASVTGRRFVTPVKVSCYLVPLLPFEGPACSKVQTFTPSNVL